MQLTFCEKYVIKYAITKFKMQITLLESGKGTRSMLFLKSRYNEAELAARWDERTSPARFAGNDDLMDAVFVAKRKQNRVILIRKARGSWDPFATVFRGRIVPLPDGSAIKGYFTKRLLDYGLLLLLLLADGYFYYRLQDMGKLGTSASIGCFAFAAILLLLAIPLHVSRRRYRSFLLDIVRSDEENQPHKENKSEK